MGGMAGSDVLVNILKPVNIVNLGNTLRCGVGRSEGPKCFRPDLSSRLSIDIYP